MSNNTAWQTLSVAEFTARCCWFGWSPEILSEVGDLNESVARLKQSLSVWQTLTTQEFFESNNWNGLAILPNSSSAKRVVDENAVFDLSLPNHKFWQCFAWSNPTKIASDPISEQNEMTKAAAEFTLTDLSQLF